MVKIKVKVSKKDSKVDGKRKRDPGSVKKRRKKRKIVLPEPEPGAFDTMLTRVTKNKAPTKEDKEDLNEEKLAEPEEIVEKKPKTPKRKKIKVTKAEEDQPEPDKLAIDYLKTWNKKRKEWSFKKVRQVWLLQHIYDEDKLSAKNFKILLNYLSGAKGAAKTKTIEDAEKLFADNSDSGELSVKIQRARDIIQHLQ